MAFDDGEEIDIDDLQRRLEVASWWMALGLPDHKVRSCRGRVSAVFRPTDGEGPDVVLTAKLAEWVRELKAKAKAAEKVPQPVVVAPPGPAPAFVVTPEPPGLAAGGPAPAAEPSTVIDPAQDQFIHNAEKPKSPIGRMLGALPSIMPS